MHVHGHPPAATLVENRQVFGAAWCVDCDDDDKTSNSYRGDVCVRVCVDLCLCLWMQAAAVPVHAETVWTQTEYTT